MSLASSQNECLVSCIFLFVFLFSVSLMSALYISSLLLVLGRFFSLSV